MPDNKNQQILNAIKQEFKQDEKMLENAFKLERLVKKYKYWLIALAVILLLWLGYRTIYNAMQESRAQKISALYDEFLQNPNNELLQTQLKEQARELYDLYQLSHRDSTHDTQATQSALEELATSANPLVQQLASYDLASLTRKDLDKIGGDLADLAIIQRAYLLLQNESIQEARTLLDTIKVDSTLYGLAAQMKHYGIIKHPLADTLTIKEVQNPTPQNPNSTDNHNSTKLDSTQVDSTKNTGASK